MFYKCKNLNDAKILYRKLALRLHPDQGGSHELMTTLQEAYENFVISLDSKEKIEPQEKERKYKNVNKLVVTLDEKLSIVDELFDFYIETGISHSWDFFNEIVDHLKLHRFVTSKQYNDLVHLYYYFDIDK